MSDFNITLSPSGLTGIEKESTKNVQTEEVDVVVPVKSEAIEKIQQKEVEEKAQDASPSLVQETVAEVNAFLQSMQRNLSFTIDDELGEKIISVKDSETEEIIRQIPSEELVVLRKKMDDVVGILFDTKV